MISRIFFPSFSNDLLSRFERELEALRKEIAESSARSSSGPSGSSTPGTLSRGSSHTDLLSLNTRVQSGDALDSGSESSSDSTPPAESKKDI